MFKKSVLESSGSKKQKTSEQSSSFDDFIKPGQSLDKQIEALEKEIMSKAIVRNRYNVTKTAEELKISRQTLYNKLKKYDLL